ncbi:hypothetical protein SCLCIDRAFT_138316 [Scleroderma citrinum Foug A]|uniref:HAT C-terminal dimerisation domain-containing protein n=1 Tax=Scleroderma citrinum Foug A TaxID=1036808 RepID=A0A0C3CYY6_9AGAM|nr:hypothetical protein SCLCIDRAFT_138316 [Scleroderma citrinum Foug A]
MAMDYLTIPATSIDIECLFSHGHILLSHMRNCLSAQSIHALLCLRSWSVERFVKSAGLQKIADLEDINGDEDVELMKGWDAINID